MKKKKMFTLYPVVGSNLKKKKEKKTVFLFSKTLESVCVSVILFHWL